VAKKNAIWVEMAQQYLFQNYGGQLPIAVVRGKGCYLWDVEGKRYLDLIGGRGTANLGHANPLIVSAIKKQVSKLLHVTNDLFIPSQIELAKLLVEKTFADRVFFCNSGAEANETAVKLARKFSKDQGRPERFEVITAKGSFHGRTLAMIAATGQEKVQKGFEPVPAGFRYVPFDDLEATAKAVDPKTCALFVEPIQGEGGVYVPRDGYLKGLRKICDENKILLIFDEVQVGLGRTGGLMAYEQEGVTPDIATVAKSLAGGVPIGAVLAREEVAQSMGPGTHGCTFGGNPLATAVGIAAFRKLSSAAFLKRVRTTGEYFRKKLNELKERHSTITEIRGRGMIWAIDFNRPVRPIVEHCLRGGLLLNATCEKTLRFLPPLVIEKSQIDEAISILDRVLKEGTE
jgi:predicted acetylornithine/succinylornithine family transaminase